MGMRRARFAIFLLVLAVAVTAAREGNDRIRFSVSGGGDASDSGGNQRETAEQAWIVHRRKKLIDRENAAKDYNLYIPKESAICVKSSLSTIKRKLYEAPDVQSAGSLVNHFHSSSQESGTQSWLIECFDSIATWSKRMLAGEPDRIITPNPPPTPTPAPAPAPAPGPVPGPISDGLAPASSPSPNSSPPVEAPGKTIFLPESFASNLSPEESPPAEKSSEDSPSRELLQHRRYKKHKDLVKELIIVVVATSLGTFALLALLFCCCFQRNSNTAGSKDGIRDEKPLLNLVDFSTSSQDNSPSLPNASHEFSASPKANGSFVSRLSMKANNHESSLGDAPTDGLPPQKSPTGKPAPPPPPPPPRSAAAAAPAPPAPPAPRPPPPPKGARGPPPAPPKAAAGGIAKRGGHTVSGDGSDPDGESGSRKAKLKPFFWDKVMASPDQAMVWHEISSGSFQFNEEMMESLFGYSEADKNRKGKKDSSSREPTVQYIHIIDRRKAQNLSILLRALNVTTEEVVDAIREGNKLPVELLQTLLKMAPTADEELKLRLYCGDMSLLGPAERFLKILVAVPFAFKRIESLIFMILFQEEVTGLKESFATLEVACKKLRNSRLFLKLLEAVLKTGNRMNVGTYRGGAQAFKLDTLLKLSDVKGTDGKSNLLHFVVQEIIRSEGIRAVRTQKSGGSLSTIKKDDLVADSSPEMLDHYRRLGLEVVSGLSTELEDVKKAAVIDADSTAATMSKLGNSLKKIRDFLESDVKNNMEEEVEYQSLLASFVEHAEADVKWLSEEEGRIMALVQSTADYFHGNAAKNEGLRVFAIVRDFLRMLDKSCKEVRESQKKTAKTSKTKETGLGSSTSLEKQQPSPVIRERLFPAIADRRVDSSSSSDDDEDSSSP